MHKTLNLIGRKFGFLTVIDFAYRDSKNTYWLCKCNCGNKKIVRGGHLKDGCTISCGCYTKNRIAQMNKQNAIHGLSKTRLYSIYQGIINRCLKPKAKGYKNYGERGISVCNEWLEDFLNFYYWALANGYKDNLTIDRIDLNKDYEPSNCRWVTIKQQARNTRHNKVINYRGQSHCLAEWAEILDINYNTLQSRLGKYNWTIKKAFTTPV